MWDSPHDPLGLRPLRREPVVDPDRRTELGPRRGAGEEQLLAGERLRPGAVEVPADGGAFLGIAPRDPVVRDQRGGGVHRHQPGRGVPGRVLTVRTGRVGGSVVGLGACHG